MKRIFSFTIMLCLLCSLCGCQNRDVSIVQGADGDDYIAVHEIDHCAVEPDDKLHMTEQDDTYYKKLMDAMLNRRKSVKLSDNKSDNEYYIDLLKQSPYYFFVDSCVLDGNTVSFTYAYSKDEQQQMLQFIDEKFLDIVNSNASEDDNELDKILNIYGAVARAMTYDHTRTDNKQLDSPLFCYPDDEIYKALKNEESLCYGFAYTLRFALLQVGIDCFCVYGPCSSHGEGHMWNIFKWEDKFYTCDPAWDRSDDGYAQLFHFGKTDKEREADTLERTGFSSTFFEEYGDIECVDETFKIFRGVDRYTYVSPHTYYIVYFDGTEAVFDTTTLKMK